MTGAYKYPGEELAVFENASNWKAYFSSHIIQFLKGKVAEVGAGIGSTTLSLNKGTATEWQLLEPDEEMASALRKKIELKQLPANCTVKKTTLGQLEQKEQFDCILYIDVLEHISDDKHEVDIAASHLKPGGRLVVLSPAFNYLFSTFDKAIGHYRRYDKSMIEKLTATSLVLRRTQYLDSIGYFASMTNKLLLKQSYPTAGQVQFWDKWMIPVSKFTDRLFFYSFGKSILSTWEKL